MSGDWGQAATAAFSFGAAVFGYLARRSGKRNSTKLDTVTRQTNGQMEDKIRRVIREEVSHEELVRAVSQDAVRDYLDHLLSQHLAEDSPPLLARPPYRSGGVPPHHHDPTHRKD